MTQVGPNICLYGCANGATFKTEYHLLPCSATQFNLVLPPGYVCDKCNNYFSELENYFTHYHPGSSNRLLAINKTRKGKEPVLKATTGDVTRKIHGELMNLEIPLESLKSETQANGDIKFHGVYRQHKYDSFKISRLLAKLTLETLHRCGSDSDCWPYRSEHDYLREYARKGSGKAKFSWFAWKSSPLIDEDCRGQPSMKSEEERIQSWFFNRTPYPIKLLDELGQNRGVLCRIPFPGITYLFPVTLGLQPTGTNKALDGWNIIDSRGEWEAPENFVDFTLIRVEEEEQAT